MDNKEDKEQFLKDNPGVKLDEFFDEQVPVKKNHFDEKTGTISQTIQLENLRTKYVYVPKSRKKAMLIIDVRDIKAAKKNIAFDKKLKNPARK